MNTETRTCHSDGNDLFISIKVLRDGARTWRNLQAFAGNPFCGAQMP